MKKRECVTDPLPLMIFYLDGGKELTSDEREILLFALYCETKFNEGGLVQRALKEMSHSPKVAMPVSQSDAKPEV